MHTTVIFSYLTVIAIMPDYAVLRTDDRFMHDWSFIMDCLRNWHFKFRGTQSWKSN